MKNKFTIDEILESVNVIYPEKKSLKKFDNKEILDSVNQIQSLAVKKEVKNSNIQETKSIQVEEEGKKEIEKNKEDYEKIIEAAADEIENFVEKANLENPIQ